MTPGRILGTISRAAAIATFAYAILLVLAWVSLGNDPKFARANVAAAFTSGDLTDLDISGANAKIGTHQFNDCLILDQAIARSGTRAQMMVTPANDLADRTAAVCQQLHLSVTEGRRGPLNFYQNYIHAHTVVARLLLSVLPIDGIRALYGSLIAALIVTGLWRAMRQALSTGATPTVIFWMCFFLVFARFFGLEYFGQSLGHGPADAVLLGYGLWLEGASFREHSRPIDFVIPAATFGALTAGFEFLTGGIPLGIAMTVAGVAMAERHDDRLRGALVQATIAFTSAIAVMALIKVVLTASLFGEGAVTSAGSQFAARLAGGAQLEQIPPPTLGNILSRMSQGLGQMMGDQPAFVLMILLLAVSFGAVGLVQLRRTDQRERATMIAASNMVLIVWVVVFNHHFYVHAWFMVRIFAWTIATGFALFAMAVAARSAQSTSLRNQPVPAE